MKYLSAFLALTLFVSVARAEDPLFNTFEGIQHGIVTALEKSKKPQKPNIVESDVPERGLLRKPAGKPELEAQHWGKPTKPKRSIYEPNKVQACSIKVRQDGPDFAPLKDVCLYGGVKYDLPLTDELVAELGAMQLFASKQYCYDSSVPTEEVAMVNFKKILNARLKQACIKAVAVTVDAQNRSDGNPTPDEILEDVKLTATATDGALVSLVNETGKIECNATEVKDIIQK